MKSIVQRQSCRFRGKSLAAPLLPNDDDKFTGSRAVVHDELTDTDRDWFSPSELIDREVRVSISRLRIEHSRPGLFSLGVLLTIAEQGAGLAFPTPVTRNKVTTERT